MADVSFTSLDVQTKITEQPLDVPVVAFEAAAIRLRHVTVFSQAD